MSNLTAHNQTHYCSFCGKSQYECLCLVAGPTGFICDQCVEFCRDIVGSHRVEKSASADTHPKDGDAIAAPLVSGAVPKADAQ